MVSVVCRQGYTGSDCSQCVAGFVASGGGVCVKYSVADEDAPIAIVNAAAVAQLELPSSSASSSSGSGVATTAADTTTTTSNGSSGATASVSTVESLADFGGLV